MRYSGDALVRMTILQSRDGRACVRVNVGSGIRSGPGARMRRRLGEGKPWSTPARSERMVWGY